MRLQRILEGGAALMCSVAAHCKQQGCKIRYNSIHPNGILAPMVLNLMADVDTGQTEVRAEVDLMARTCLPQDIANLVLFLASKKLRSINGAELRIDKVTLVTDA